MAGLTVFAVMAVAATESCSEADFTAENAAAMARMMKGMDVEPSGNVDLDFARMMTAHHQGAIDMALAELRHGRNERLRRLAQGIVVEQRQEIESMQMVIDRELPRSDASASATTSAMTSAKTSSNTAAKTVSSSICSTSSVSAGTSRP